MFTVILLVIISFILMTLVCDSGVILQVEIKCMSLLGFKRLKSSFLQNKELLKDKINKHDQMKK